MSEKLSSHIGPDASSDWDILRTPDDSFAGRYQRAVTEIAEEYDHRTPFERKVMMDLIIDDESEEKMQDDDYWRFRSAGPTVEGIKKEFEYEFNSGMNCGGFALGIFSCIFLSSKNINDASESVLSQFPFVRLMDDEGLRPNEYPVIYRCNDHGGHHFIKVEGDKIIEKDGSGPVRDFVEWPDTLKDAPEVTFAVNRDHDIKPRDEDGGRVYSYWI